jgi:hypothetical protein
VAAAAAAQNFLRSCRTSGSRGTCELFSSLHARFLAGQGGQWGEETLRSLFLSAEGLNREPVVVDAFALSSTGNNALCKTNVLHRHTFH